jgi:diaminopimelate decarboxylase
VSLDEVAERFGTPVYVYDTRGIEERVSGFVRAFEEIPFLLAYSVKANGSLAILNRIAALGAGADIVSLGELARAVRAGVPADRIVFSGVGKTEEELIAGLDAGIHAFHVESAQELEMLSELGAQRGVVAPVSLRVNPDVHSPTPHEYTRTGHAASKFGISTSEAEALYRSGAEDPHLQFRGIGVHIGSQIIEVDPYVEALDLVLNVVDRLSEVGVQLDYVDLGGGFGVGYEAEAGLDLNRLSAQVIPRIRQRNLRLILEPGRSIVGEAGVLLTRVLYVKRADGKTFIVADGGMTELLRPSHYGGFHRITPVRHREGTAPVLADVVGPVCETGDFLARDREILLPEAGDVLAVETAGAYGFSMASNYNARRRPAEVMIEDGEVRLIRRRETAEDLMRGEEIPARDAGADSIMDQGSA